VPSVGVIIAARNAQATIGRAVASALDQPETREIIVVDDASNDATAEAARACDPSGLRVKIVTMEQNVGPAAARNAALARLTSPLVTILDADDFMLPGRLERLIKAMGSADMVGDDLSLSLDSAPLRLTGRLIGLRADTGLDLATFARGNIARRDARRRELGFLKPLMRREFLERHSLTYDPSLRLGEDFDLYARALASGAAFRLTPACGYVAVERSNSLSGSHRIEDLAAFHSASQKLARRDGLDPDTRGALTAHSRSVYNRLAHRLFLDVKRTGGVSAALKWLVDRPGDVSTILLHTLRDKLRG
jgi:succinoglycan biosynthesis protein ExoU